MGPLIVVIAFAVFRQGKLARGKQDIKRLMENPVRCDQ